MINKTTIQKITDQEMDRRTFLKYSGLMLVSLVGLRGIVALLTGEMSQSIVKQTIDTPNTRPNGFGGGKYGA